MSFENSNIVTELSEITYKMWSMGWDESNGGNVSVLLDQEDEKELPNLSLNGKLVPFDAIPENLIGKYLLITASGSHFSELHKNVRNETGVIRLFKDYYEVIWGFENDGAPTSELDMHLHSHSVRLKQDASHRVVVHNHATEITAYSQIADLNDKDFTLSLWRVLTESVVVFPDGVGILRWQLPGTKAIAIETAKKLKNCRIVVWELHGILATGSSFKECFGLIETVNKAAKINLLLSDYENRRLLLNEDILSICEALGTQVRSDFLE